MFYSWFCLFVFSDICFILTSIFSFYLQLENPNKRLRISIIQTPKKTGPERVPAKKLAMLTPPNLNQFSIVWVKVRGYKDWPGVIEAEIRGRYRIHFFGDYTTFTVTRNKITNFYEGFGIFKHTFDDPKLKKAVQEACICMMSKTDKCPDYCSVCAIVKRTIVKRTIEN